MDPERPYYCVGCQRDLTRDEARTHSCSLEGYHLSLEARRDERAERDFAARMAELNKRLLYVTDRHGIKHHTGFGETLD